MLLTCLFKCSPRAKHFPHPSTSHRYILAPFVPVDALLLAAPAFLLPLPLPEVAPAPVPEVDADSFVEETFLNSSKLPTVGTRLPRLFFVRLGTGTGTGRLVGGLAFLCFELPMSPALESDEDESVGDDGAPPETTPLNVLNPTITADADIAPPAELAAAELEEAWSLA
jgi:hypothetical protein